jgi:hypothetical protein
MLRKILRFSEALPCMFLISVSVYADVVRTWDVSGILKQKITIKGGRVGQGKASGN